MVNTNDQKKGAHFITEESQGLKNPLMCEKIKKIFKHNYGINFKILIFLFNSENLIQLFSIHKILILTFFYC